MSSLTDEPQPPKPTPPVPSPAQLAKRPASADATPPPATPSIATSESVKFGRVAQDGTVYVRTGDTERAVGSYPGSSPEEALRYFARKYDELAAAAELLHQRVTQTDLSAHEAAENLKKLRAQVGDAHVVGDLAALESRIEQVAGEVTAKQQLEQEQRAQARAEAAARREELVAEAEQIAAQAPERTQWKSSGTRMRALLDRWKSMQRTGPRLDKPTENELWRRFSNARNSFDKNRRTWFARLDEEHAESKKAKEALVREAEALAASKDWGATAGAFKRLMERWRAAGRAHRADDDALWQRFKTAQDSFFAAKDEVVAAETAEFEANLKVKEALLVEAEALLPVTESSDSTKLESTKAALRSIQDRWEAAGKVPRKDMARVEARIRRVEQAVRDVHDKRWTSTNPEAAARAQSLVDQLEGAVGELEADLARARDSGDQRKVADAEQALQARREWLDRARAGLQEFGS